MTRAADVRTGHTIRWQTNTARRVPPEFDGGTVARVRRHGPSLSFPAGRVDVTLAGRAVPVGFHPHDPVEVAA